MRGAAVLPPESRRSGGWRFHSDISLFLSLSFCFFISGKGDGEGEPADVRMSGQPGNCYGGILNGVWAYEGDTADGKRFYSRDTGNNERYRGVIHLYFDKDSDNGKSPGGCGEGAAYNNKWYIDEQKPSTTAANDLDGDGSCFTYLSSRLPDTSGSLAPPASAEWTLQCNGKWTGTTLFFQPICETPAPDWTYTFPDEWTTVLAGCGNGIARQRTAAESCPARGGCDCQNRRATLPTETEPQEPCQSSSDGEGDPADVWMGGQPVGCNGGGLNGAWAYEGDTADGKRYYSRAVGSVYASNGFPVMYLYFDRDSDNGQNPAVCGTGAKGNNDWHIDNNKPSTTAAQDLDGDYGCVGFAASIQPDTSGSPTPPATTEWGVTCSGQVAFMTLSFDPIACETPAPDWTYTYPDEWTVVNAGCGTGIARQRTEIESCPARGGCDDCQNQRDAKTATEMRPPCADGEGDPADMRVSGQRSECRDGHLNGVWSYEGDTADGKRYYSHNTGRNPAVVFLYFDKDPDNGRNPGVCGADNRWLIHVKPNTTAVQDLDGDNGCTGFAFSPEDTSGSLTPPASARWKVACSGQLTYTMLSFDPICDDTFWTYTYPEGWTDVGCEGGSRAWQRTEIESCPARGGCNCAKRRKSETETRAFSSGFGSGGDGTVCATTTITTTTMTTTTMTTISTTFTTTTTATTTTSKPCKCVASDKAWCSAEVTPNGCAGAEESCCRATACPNVKQSVLDGKASSCPHANSLPDVCRYHHTEQMSCKDFCATGLTNPMECHSVHSSYYSTKPAFKCNRDDATTLNCDKEPSDGELGHLICLCKSPFKTANFVIKGVTATTTTRELLVVTTTSATELHRRRQLHQRRQQQRLRQQRLRQQA